MGNLTSDELLILESIKKSLQTLDKSQLEEVIEFTRDLKNRKYTSGVDKKSFFQLK